MLFPGGCFQPNPEQRLTITDLLERLAAIAESHGFNLKAPLPFKVHQLQPEQATTIRVIYKRINS